ncbi:DUF1707 SHOCT-like domain-containing protein [Microlunatus sp. Y2014]|uniref:DUF1707 SHOCT-like domain-containing protein n=1 Tax=Microlunatus sp. Y2014 TaxID=3418488 RepID=UPI003DA71A86
MASDPSDARLRASNGDRDDVVAVLTEAHANGRLDDAELADRTREVRATRFTDDLSDLIVDLPEGHEIRRRFADATADVSGASAAVAPVSAASPPAPWRTSTPGTELATTAGSGDVENSVAIMGGHDVVVKPGTPIVRSYALMGGNNIHLRDVMGPGVEITLELFSMWGGNDIFVPPGVRIIDKCISVMAGNGIEQEARGDGSRGTLILKGFSLMAGNDVKLDKDAPPPPAPPTDSLPAYRPDDLR